MKNIALLRYTVMFDPSEGWSSGSQFEASLSDFFAAHGYEAQVIETKGGTGERVIWLEKLITAQTIAQDVPQPQPTTSASEQIKSIQNKPNPQEFKRFKRVHGVPINAKIHIKKSLVNKLPFKQRIPNNPYDK